MKKRLLSPARAGFSLCPASYHRLGEGGKRLF